MDPILDRLGTLFKSFLQSEDRDYDFTFDDRDQQDAWDELEEFLKTGNSTSQSSYRRESSYSYSSGGTSQGDILLQKAYMVLGVSSQATMDEIKIRHKELLRKHHPDRHAGDDSKVAEATKKTQAINEAFQLIKKSRQGR